MRPERAGSDLPSRVAENLFWLGRYAERAEHTMRLLRSVVVRLTDQDTTRLHSSCRRCSRCWSSLKMLPERFAKRDAAARARAGHARRSSSKESPHAALRQTLNELRRIASVVRDRLSMDTWRILNQLHQDFRLRHGRIQFDDVLAHLNRMITDLAAFSGMEMENMTRGHGWRFLDVGRRLERAMNADEPGAQRARGRARTTRCSSRCSKIADSTMTYRRRYFARPQLAPVLDLLLLDDTNTRAAGVSAGGRVGARRSSCPATRRRRRRRARNG